MDDGNFGILPHVFEGLTELHRDFLDCVGLHEVVGSNIASDYIPAIDDQHA